MEVPNGLRTYYIWSDVKVFRNKTALPEQTALVRCSIGVSGSKVSNFLAKLPCYCEKLLIN